MSSPHEPPNHWVRIVAVALTVIVAVYGLVGWLNVGQWLFAGLCVVAQAAANNASAQARRAKGKRLWASMVFMVAAMAGFSLVSAISLEHAWAVDHGLATAAGFDLAHAARDPMFPLLAFLAAVEPAMYWAVEAIERAPVADAPPAVAENRAPAPEAADNVTAFPASGARTSAALAGMVAGVAGMSAGGSAMLAELQPAAIFEQPSRTGDGPHALAERLLNAGVSQRMAAERTGLTRYAVSQIKAAMGSSPSSPPPHPRRA